MCIYDINEWKLFENDLIESDIVGENYYNIFEWLRLAYHRNATVQPFKEINDVCYLYRDDANHCTMSCWLNGIRKGRADYAIIFFLLSKFHGEFACSESVLI